MYEVFFFTIISHPATILAAARSSPRSTDRPTDTRFGKREEGREGGRKREGREGEIASARKYPSPAGWQAAADP